LTIELRKIQPSVVHNYGHSANLIGRIAAILAGVPNIIVSERNVAFIKTKTIKIIDKCLAPFTGAMIANSAHAVKYWVTHGLIAKKKAWTVCNGVNVSMYPRSHGSAEGIRLVTAGVMIGRKNHAFLLQVLANIVRNMPSVCLTIAGDGPMRSYLESLAVQLDIVDNVIFLGFVDDMPRVFNESDIYLHAADYEGVPNVVMEAMACGLPCIVTDSDGCLELVKDGSNGIVVTNGNVNAMVEAIIVLLQKIDVRREMGRLGRERIENDFSIKKMVDDTELIYDKLCN